MKNRGQHSGFTSGFTIVELLIVVVVIAILAAITIVSYNGITKQAKISIVKSDLEGVVKQLQLAQAESGSYPATIGAIKKSDTTTLRYHATASTFCVTAASDTVPDVLFHATQAGAIEDGQCSVEMAKNGDNIQTINGDNCPTTKIVAVDARDKHSYWVKKMPDGNCWMLTNLAYAGDVSNGGTAIYGDVKQLINATADAEKYFEGSRYYIPAKANPTTYPDTPSTSTDGGVTNPQYGYFYTFCAANGGQEGTNACTNLATPRLNSAISICPAGWRLPLAGNEFLSLNSSIGNGEIRTPALLQTEWLSQLSGYWNGAFLLDGASTRFWSSTQYTNPDSPFYGNSFVYSNAYFYTLYGVSKYFGHAVRCVAL